MLRTALKPRWLALFLVVLAAATVMARLGQWQWDRAHERSAVEARQAQLARPAVPLESLLAPRTTFPEAAADRRVRATGTWDAARQLLVADRLQQGARGFWVLTPLRRDDGSAVGVVRGWVASVTDPAAAAAVPAGRVELVGVLRPGESGDVASAADRSRGVIPWIDPAELIKVWPYPLLTGYVVAESSTPAASPAPAPVSTAPATGEGVNWQNLSYAVQWFLFAGFGLFLWWRLVRDDHLGRLPGPRPVDPARPTAGEPADTGRQ